jgi:hypothetical protein
MGASELLNNPTGVRATPHDDQGFEGKKEATPHQCPCK